MSDHERDLSRRRFLRLAGVSMIGLPASAAGGWVYSTQVEPANVEITWTTLTLPRLPRAFDGYRLVHLTDIHMDNRWMTGRRLHAIVDLVNAHAPDFIALTGDFVTGGDIDAVAAPLVDALSRLRAADGSAAVLGNHDHWTDAAGVRRVLADSGIVELANHILPLIRDNAALIIAGVDDVWEQKADLERVLSWLPDGAGVILLAHEPDFADSAAATRRFDLQLSGHSHGGQVRFPVIGAPVLPWLGERYPAGLYSVGGMRLYTSRGLGMVAPQVRFNCRPEIALFTLRSGQPR